jgi:hypothetical protein
MIASIPRLQCDPFKTIVILTMWKRHFRTSLWTVTEDEVRELETTQNGELHKPPDWCRNLKHKFGVAEQFEKSRLK